MKISHGFLPLWLFGSLLLTTLPGPLPAQDPSPTPAPGLTTWECALPGGTFVVAVRSIVSVSSHEYLVDGARVVEVNIDTTGNMAARFYYLEPATPNLPVGQSVLNQVQNMAEVAGERVAPDAPWQKVIKVYPATTHAHTIEYRLNAEGDVKKIVESASRALQQNISVKLAVK